LSRRYDKLKLIGHQADPVRARLSALPERKLALDWAHPNLLKGEVMAEQEKGSLLGKAVHAGERVVELGAEAARLKVRASHAVEDTMVEARRLAKRGRHAAEDLVDETAYRIKRDPLRSVAITFAVGLGIGALAGWLTGRSGRR
jgi:ElaB/YqjD/DUF883 family membrane-anchored ribosome-binding protein